MSQILLIPKRGSTSRLLVATSSQYFQLGSGPAPGTGPFSAGGFVWMVDAAATYAILATGGATAAVAGWRLYVNTNRRVLAGMADGSAAVVSPDTGTQMALTAWNHLAIVRDTGVTPALLRCYLNGTEVSTVNCSDVNNVTAGHATSRVIGTYTTSAGFANARVARMFYSDQILTGTDLAAMIAGAPTYAKMPATQKAKLVHFWNLDIAGNALDSVTTNHGAETNGPIARAKGP